MANSLATRPAAFSRGVQLSGSKDQVASAKRLATLLDDAFRLPGTNVRFGWDTIIGLVPGVGDAATTVLALAPVSTAWKLGASRWMLTKMLMNVGVDATLGSIPIVGDIFDLFFRANRRNARMLATFNESRRQEEA